MILFRKVHTLYKIVKENLYRRGIRKNLQNKSFSILSNNCWGGGVYEDLGLAYTTPTVGLFFHGPCYMKFLQRLDYYLSLDLKFIEESVYSIANEKRNTEVNYYPIALLDDIEIHFLHYHSVTEAIEKWNRRKERINYDNLFVEFGENEMVDFDLMQQFDKLPFKNKVLLSSKNFKELQSLIWLPQRQNFDDIGDVYTYKNVWRKEFDVVQWLNEGFLKKN